MIGTQDISISAHNPQFPLECVFTYINSPSSIRLRNVPRSIGQWKLTNVYFDMVYPNGETIEVDCVMTGGVWIGTVDGCEVAGTSKNGFIVKADGVDENNKEVNGYVLGVGDVHVLDQDGRIVPQESLKVVNIVPSKSPAPHVGDAVWVDEVLEIYDGETWRKTANGTKDYNALTNKPSINSIELVGDFAPSELGLQDTLPLSEEYAGSYNIVVDNAHNSDFAQEASWAVDAGGVDWDNVQNKPNIPTKTSELENDSEFVDREALQDLSNWVFGIENNVNGLTNRVDAIEGQIPTKTSQLENDSGFLDGTDKDELNERIDLIQATSHPNMNVIGSPTFSQGSVGGFSENDYLMFPTSVNVGQNNVVFHMSFTTGDNVSNQENILDSWCGLALAIQNGHFILAASWNGTAFNTSTGSSTVLANTSYDIKITFTYEAGMYIVELLVNDANDAYISMDAPLFPTSTYWGGANPSSGVNHIFGGTINLNECWMSWNGEVIWRGYSELPIPTKVSQLDNDVGYTTQEYVDSQIGQVLTEGF